MQCLNRFFNISHIEKFSFTDNYYLYDCNKSENELILKGTTLKSDKTIGISNDICIINHDVIKPKKSLGRYPNSMDEYGIVYFSLDNHQALRLAIYEYSKIKLNNLEPFGPSVLFIILSHMSLIYISGSWKSEYIIELRKIAIIQMSIYYEQLKNGFIPIINYSKLLTFKNLYVNKMINPLQLSESLWWGLMMSMLGLYDEQEHSILFFNTKNNIYYENQFLNFIVSKYQKNLKQQFILLNLESQISVFTLEHFKFNQTIYVLMDHKKGNYKCTCKTWYTLEEKNNYVKNKGCVYCHYIPRDNEYNVFEFTNPYIELKNAIKQRRMYYIYNFLNSKK